MPLNINLPSPKDAQAEIDQQKQQEAMNSPEAKQQQAMAMVMNQDPKELAQQMYEAGQIDEQQNKLAQAMGDPVATLKAMATHKEKEVSLKTLKKSEREKILRSYLNCRDIAVKHYHDKIEPEIIKRRNIYEANVGYYKEKFPQLSQYSDWCSKDVQTTCQWILPGLMEVFTGSEEPISIKGVNVNDDVIAEKLQKLIQYQLEKKNDYHQFCMSELEVALADNFGIAKVWWNRIEKRTPMDLMLDLKEDNGIVALMQAANEGTIEINKIDAIEGTDDFLKVSYDEVEIKANHPVLDFIPSSEFRYTPDAPDIKDCKFVAHRKVVNGSYLKQRESEGIYENIDKAIMEFGSGNTKAQILDRVNDPDRAESSKHPSDGDLASKEIELYEAYLLVDYNNDGIFEKVIVHAVGDNLIRVAENDFERPPFFICCAKYDPNAVFNKEGFADSFEQLQDLKTAIMRQVIVNVAKNNAPRLFVDDTRVDMDALLSGEEIIPVTGGDLSSHILTPPALQLSPITMSVLDYVRQELEEQSGSTKYNKGLDSNSLNSTATGVTAILGASEKRNKLVARAIAERFFIPMYKFLILLNQKYLDQNTTVRLLDENLEINKEELDIDYDLVVNVGQGPGSKEAQIQYLMYALQSIYPQLNPLGIVNAKSWYNLCSKLLETLGLRNVAAYLMDPDSMEAKQAAQQAAAEAASQKAEALQEAIQLALAKTSVPRVSVNINDMPPDVQRQYLLDKFGIETTEAEIAKYEELERASKGGS